MSDGTKKILTDIVNLITEIYAMGLHDGGNDALDAAAKLADDGDGKPTRLSEEIRSLKK